ncbi:unnamed protein product [Orchesella dallaii]|uniref:CUB domain-containing protein n=1 Tax=Orchesella dallaii TaxID=48710 RepID=A0ABP1S1I6_9HEXA
MSLKHNENNRGSKEDAGVSSVITNAQDQCNKTVGIYEEVTSPQITQENHGKTLLCHYRFRPFRTNLRDWVLRIRFTKFKVGRLVNDSYCENGYVQIVDGNGKSKLSNGREPGKLCGEIEQPQTFISETSVVKIVFYVENFTEQTYFRFDSRAEQQYEVYLRYGQHPELYPNRRGEVVPNTYCERVFRDCRMQTCYVQSPAYPGIYPRNLHCKYYLNTRLPSIKLHIENEEFNVDGQRCENLMLCPMRAIGSECPNDYIKVYDGKDEKSPVIGTFCGMGKFPYSIVGSGSDLFVEFVTSPAGPLLNTGFHFNVAHWPGHVDTSGKKNGTCDWIFTSQALVDSGDKQGLFWSEGHWYPPSTSCTYLILGKPEEIVRLYFPSFRILRIDAPIRKWEGECGESLTIYDAAWADDSKIIKTFCDTFSKPSEKQEFISTSNALFVRFESKTGSYSGSSLYYWAHYDFFNNSHFGDSVGGTLCDEVFTSWRTFEGRFTSPLNTLIYQSGGQPVVCRYRFITSRRLFARVVLRIENVNFKYNQDSCVNCWENRVDKVILMDKHRNASRICLCKENQGQYSYPVTLTSQGEEAEVTLKIDPRHALNNYFKINVPIFEGSYRFMHGPLCGPTELGPSADGKLRFPFYYNPSLRDQPVSCLWELMVHPDKDLWIHLDKLVFAMSSKSCQDAKLEFYLPSKPTASITPGVYYNPSLGISPYHSYVPPKLQHQPLLTLCGDSNVGDRKTEITSELPILSAQKLLQGGPLTIRLEASAASKLNFIISWTELYQLPKNPDGSLMTSKLELKGEDCGFICPGPEGVCIAKELVCNGVQNCPSNVTGAHDESESKCKSTDNQFIVFNVQLNITWVTASVVGGSLALLFCFCCVICCRCCRRKEPDDPDY